MLFCLFTCWERTDCLTLLCVVFSCVFVTFSILAGSTSELRVRLVPLYMLKPSSIIFTDSSSAVLFVEICIFVFVFVILSCLFLAAL